MAGRNRNTGSDRSSSNLGSHQGKDKTSGSREESMQDSSREFGEDLGKVKRTAHGGTQDLNRDRETTPGNMGDGSPDDASGMSGSSSGTTGLGGERNRSSTGSVGGVEGVSDKSNPTPDEDKSRHR